MTVQRFGDFGGNGKRGLSEDWNPLVRFSGVAET